MAGPHVHLCPPLPLLCLCPSLTCGSLSLPSGGGHMYDAPESHLCSCTFASSGRTCGGSGPLDAQGERDLPKTCPLSMQPPPRVLERAPQKPPPVLSPPGGLFGGSAEPAAAAPAPQAEYAPPVQPAWAQSPQPGAGQAPQVCAFEHRNFMQCMRPPHGQTCSEGVEEPYRSSRPPLPPSPPWHGPKAPN